VIATCIDSRIAGGPGAGTGIFYTPGFGEGLAWVEVRIIRDGYIINKCRRVGACDEVAEALGVIVGLVNVAVGGAATVGGTSVAGTCVGVGGVFVPQAERKKIIDKLTVKVLFISISISAT